MTDIGLSHSRHKQGKKLPWELERKVKGFKAWVFKTSDTSHWLNKETAYYNYYSRVMMLNLMGSGPSFISWLHSISFSAAFCHTSSTLAFFAFLRASQGWLLPDFGNLCANGRYHLGRPSQTTQKHFFSQWLASLCLLYTTELELIWNYFICVFVCIFIVSLLSVLFTAIILSANVC